MLSTRTSRQAEKPKVHLKLGKIQPEEQRFMT